MILRAAWIVPVARPPIRGGAVRIADDRIIAVGPADAVVAGAPDDDVSDLGEVALTPGLVNPHAHLELTCYAGRLEPADFWAWLWALVALRREPGQVERESAAAITGAWESLRSGVTCVGDISRRNLNWRGLRDVPIRKVCFVELLSLADHPPRDVDELKAAVAEVEEDELLTVGVTPHTPYTVQGPAIRESMLLADTLERPWCTHWAESREERAFLRGEADAFPEFVQAFLAQCQVASPKCEAFEFLEWCARGASPGALAHCNYLVPGDAERLAAAGHVVMYCPRAHRFFGHAPHSYREMLAAGVTVALGTDSAASNEDLALLKEAGTLLREDPQAPSAERLLEMVTRDAARALGLADRIGTLEAGKQADLVAFPVSAVSDNSVRELLEQTPAAERVWVAGRRVI